MNQIFVWHALVLHDIKSRWFGTGIGYALSILWPLVHIVTILLLNHGRIAPYGTSMSLYAATGVIPYIACNYIGRFILLGVIMNRSFLNYPVIKPIDLMISRAYLEFVGNALVTAIILSGMALLSIDVVPVDVPQAALAWLASVMLGTGLGFLFGTIVLAFPLFNLLYVLIIIIIWVTCGVFINPESVPEPYSYYLSFNPVMHAVEWMRLAYYPNMHVRLLDKTYLVTFAFICFAAGLLLERSFRSFWLKSR